LIKINRAELGLLQSKSSQLRFIEAAESEHRGVLVVGGDIICANPEQQERSHVPHHTRLPRIAA
jgi:glutathione synthase/RimK-type ligase-like ATP-grasp enzyme